MERFFSQIFINGIILYFSHLFFKCGGWAGLGEGSKVKGDWI